MESPKANAAASKVVDSLFENEKISSTEGRERKLFASAITPDGFKNYLSSILTTETVYVLKGDPGTGTEKLLEKVKTAAIERGQKVEAYYCALNPTKLEHLVIPVMDVAFTTVNEYHNSNLDPFEVIDFNEYKDKIVSERYAQVMEYNKSEFKVLMSKAIETIGKAKAMHDEMETYYVPNMDFDAIERCFEVTLARIIGYANEIN